MADVKRLKAEAPVGSILSRMSEAEIAAAVERANKLDERTKYYGARKRITDALYIQKAKEKGIKVTKEEVDAEMKKRGYTK